MSEKLLELVIVGVYLLFLMGVGFSFRKFNADSSDYFRAGAKGTWWLVGSSIFMSGISSYTFVGNGAGIYESGWSPLVIYGANTMVFVLSFLIFAAWFRQLRAVTVGEVVRERFGPRTEQFVAYLFVLNALFWSAMQLYGLAIFSRMLLGDLNTMWVILIVGGVVLVYATIGGNWAVMANDFVQSLILVPITVLVAFLCLQKVGGWDGFQSMIAANPETARDFKMVNSADEFDAGKYGPWWILAVFIGQLLGQLNMTQGAIRFFSVKDGWEGKKASLLAGILMAVGCFVWFIPPMTGRLLYEEQIMASTPDPAKAAESAYAITSFNVLPLGLTGVMVVAMFAATISSMDTGLNRNAALIVRDIIPAILRIFKLRKIPHTAEVILSRAVTVGMGAVIILLALSYSQLKGTDLFEIALNFMAIILIPTSVPMLLAFLVKRTAPWAAASSILLGFLPSLFQLVSGVDWSFQQRTFLITGGALLGYFISMPFYRRSPAEYRERVEGFFTKMHRPVDFEKEVGVSNDGIQMLIIGRYALALGGFLALLVFVPNPLWGRLSVVTVAGSVLLVGGILLAFGRRQHAREKKRLEAAAAAVEERNDKQ